jgi:hypothetical protein
MHIFFFFVPFYSRSEYYLFCFFALMMCICDFMIFMSMSFSWVVGWRVIELLRIICSLWLYRFVRVVFSWICSCASWELVIWISCDRVDITQALNYTNCRSFAHCNLVGYSSRLLVTLNSPGPLDYFFQVSNRILTPSWSDSAIL